jgi:hypothetical protein
MLLSGVTVSFDGTGTINRPDLLNISLYSCFDPRYLNAIRLHALYSVICLPVPSNEQPHLSQACSLRPIS